MRLAALDPKIRLRHFLKPSLTTACFKLITRVRQANKALLARASMSVASFTSRSTTETN